MARLRSGVESGKRLRDFVQDPRLKKIRLAEQASRKAPGHCGTASLRVSADPLPERGAIASRLAKP
jgi:hypothetical protein